ncbi:MAG: glycosyltransferase family 4 protein [Chitinophagaceae bacterium]|nr:glycosyltransferase family 4 protein [Chitinophagaceae bacterium]
MNNSKNKKIVILCSRLDLPGGIERAIVNTANLFIENSHSVSIIILDHTEETFYPIDSKVNIVQRPLSFGITKDGNIITRKLGMLSDVLQLRKLLKKLSPDIVIATDYPFAVAAILTRIKKQTKVFSWEHHHRYELNKNQFWTKLFNYSYPVLDAVVCLNEDEKKLFQSLNKKSVVIPNFIQRGNDLALLKNKTILTIARLVHVKGIDLLISTAKKIFQQHPDWSWKVIGTCDDVESIKKIILQEGLAEKLIIQIPVDHNIISEYLNASIYVMTSRNECFPMVLLEAQSVGLPCIAFDCETGPRHIISTNVDGILVEKENTDKLAEALSSLITNEGGRIQMGKAAFENVQRFSPDAIYKLWEENILLYK